MLGQPAKATSFCSILTTQISCIASQEPMEKPYFKKIADSLNAVERPGCYAAGGLITMPLPSLSVAGHTLGLPLCEAQAKTLIELASRAPFGRGELTIVDTSVRCTWQLSPSQFTIDNPDWEESMQTLLARVKADLGCSVNLTVTCELYKLLLYEPGGFFKVSCGASCHLLISPTPLESISDIHC